MADREKAFSDERHKQMQMQMELQKQKEDEPPPKPKKSKKSKKNKKKSKKRKNRSSASDSTSDSENTESDSDQDMSRSIRVAMRNKMKAATQAILNEEIDYHGIKLKGNWAQVAQVKTPATPEMPPPENDDRQLLNSIRDKLKAKQEEEMKNNSHRRHSLEKPPTLVPPPPPSAPKEDIKPNLTKKPAEGLEAWGPKEPPKPFWIKKDEEKLAPQAPPAPSKSLEIPKTDEIPKPHMGFWTKQQVNMTVKPPDSKPVVEKEEEQQKEVERERYKKDDRDRKYDRREDKYERSDRYERRRGGRDRDRERDRDRDRDSEYYDDRRKSRYNDSPRRDRNWRDRESPKRSYDKYSSKDNRREDNNSSNDESKFEKKTNESATKLKKGSTQSKKPAPPVTKSKPPFIGRLPLFKKKTEEPKMSDKADIAPLPYQQSKFEDTPKVPSEIINPPGVVHITKLATPVNLNNSIPAKVTPAPMKILVAPPPPVLRTEAKSALTTQQVVDMEIEDQSDETIIEEPIVHQQKHQPTPTALKLPALPPHPPPALTRPPPTFAATPQPSQIAAPQIFTPNRPPPFIPTNPPPFVPANTRFTVRPPVPQTPYVAPQDGVSLAAAAASYAQAHGNPPPQITPVVDPIVPDISEIPEPAEKRPDPSIPLPDDLQEALNIIFPKEETPETKAANQSALPDTSVMYSSMYSMLGCVGYGPEYMDQPPPEITQADTDTDAEAQPGPDDLRMLGIDEGDTIF